MSLISNNDNSNTIYYAGLARNNFLLFWESGCMPVPSINADPPVHLLPSQKRLSSCHLRTDFGIINAEILVNKAHSLSTASG